MTTKVAYVPWYNPRPLMQWDKERKGFDRVGWVWRQKAYLIKNTHHGWIAFVDNQTKENLNKCCKCGK